MTEPTVKETDLLTTLSILHLFILLLHVLGQGSAIYGLWAKTGLLPPLWQNKRRMFFTSLKVWGEGTLGGKRRIFHGTSELHETQISVPMNKV